MPRVSVIIPTYNRASLLVEAVRSVRAQTYTDYEIIVVDDGSTDETCEHVKALEVPIRYRSVERSGRPGFVRNRALELARGDLIAFLDDDDVWHPSKLDRQVALLDNDETIGFVYSDVRFLYPDGSRSAPILRPHQKQTDRLLSKLIRDCYIYPSTVLMRRRLLSKVGFFDEVLTTGEDYDLWLRLASTTGAACVSAPLAFIRRHPSSLSQQQDIRAYQHSITVLERFVQSTSLSLRQRLSARTALSRRNTHVGFLLSNQGNRRRARSHFVQSLRLNPLQRRAWIALARSYTSARP